MQTFLPVPDYKESAAILDYRRLGKQRVEALTLLRQLMKPEVAAGWKNHPLLRMWRSHENALVLYALEMCEEWIRRGYNDTIRTQISSFYVREKVTIVPQFPEELHASHRSNLLRKDFEYYRRFGWTEDDSLPYYWPQAYEIHG